eukprot:4902228-Amphidinium_carterae.1
MRLFEPPCQGAPGADGEDLEDFCEDSSGQCEHTKGDNDEADTLQFLDPLKCTCMQEWKEYLSTTRERCATIPRAAFPRFPSSSFESSFPSRLIILRVSSVMSALSSDSD